MVMFQLFFQLSILEGCYNSIEVKNLLKILCFYLLSKPLSV